MDSKDLNDSPSNAFLQLLARHQRGATCGDLADVMRRCVEAVQLTGKPAVLHLEVKFLPAGRGGASVLLIAPKVSSKLPLADTPTSIWFADENGNLHREDPRQTELPLRAVPAPDAGGRAQHPEEGDRAQGGGV